jgi:trk system potassium uptake protein TrkA
MNVIVIGCGRFGAELASRLHQKGHQVAIVDQTAAAFDNLDPDFRGRVIEGDVLSQDMLRRAGIEQADGVAAVTNSDTLNGVVGHIARTVFHVPNVVVRNYDPAWRPMYEAFGLQVVSSTSWGSQRVEDMLFRPDVRSVFSAGNGEIEIYEFLVPERWNGRQIGDLLPDLPCGIVALTRAGRAFVPDCDVILEADDVVYFSTTLEGVQMLHRLFEEG